VTTFSDDGPLSGTVQMLLARCIGDPPERCAGRVVHEPVTTARSYVETPHEWERLAVRRVGAFVTAETFRRADGRVVTWRSRAHRKHGRGRQTGSTWWAPHALAWWIGALFIIGSACFAIGALPGYLAWVGYRADALTFFVGSLFFTSAAFLQYVEVAVAPRAAGTVATSTGPPRLGIEPRRIDWWAVAVQLVGTLSFNVTTFAALWENLDAEQARRLIWTPDALGSICFLVASELAFAEVGHRLVSWLPHSREWQITALNMVGSIAFGLSAIGSFVLPTTGEPASVWLTNMGTFVGALCFLAGAVLLLYERTDPEPS
jgi:hypothetical protein